MKNIYSNAVIGAKPYSAFGFKAICDAGFMKRIYTLTAHILAGSGSENSISNHVDAEKIDCFI